MYITQKISIRIDDRYIGYLYWYAKRYRSAILDGYNFLRRAIGSKSRRKKALLDKIYLSTMNEQRKVLAKRHKLYSVHAHKAFNDAYVHISAILGNRARHFPSLTLKPQIATGFRTADVDIDLDKKILSLAIKIPEIKKKGLKWKVVRIPINLRIRNPTLRRLKEAIENKYKIAIRIVFLSLKKAYLVFYIDYPDPTKLPEKNKYLGIDINFDRLAFCLVKKDGNPIYFRTKKFNIIYKSRQERIRIISDILDEVFRELKHEEFTIVLENLEDLKRKYDNRLRKTIIAYRLVQKLILSKAAKNFIPVRFVVPDGTSKVARKKYRRVFRGRSVHELAAYLIARRYLFPLEKITLEDLRSNKTLRNLLKKGFIQIKK